MQAKQFDVILANYDVSRIFPTLWCNYGDLFMWKFIFFFPYGHLKHFCIDLVLVILVTSLILC